MSTRVCPLTGLHMFTKTILIGNIDREKQKLLFRYLCRKFLEYFQRIINNLSLMSYEFNDSEMYYCDICGEYLPLETMYELQDGCIVCEDCLNE